MVMRRWEYFVAVADERHFGRAAARLHVAQPAVSRQIRLLEEELGVTLLQRTHRRVVLTPAGAVFLERARRILGDMDQAVDVTRRLHRGDAGVLRLGFIASTTTRVMPNLVRRYREAYPAVEVSLCSATTRESVDRLRRGSLDVALVRTLDLPDDVHVSIIGSEPLTAVLPTGHPLGLGTPRALLLRDLSGYPLVIYPATDHPGIHRQILTILRQHGVEPIVAQEAGEGALVGLVAAGVGVGLVIGTDHTVPTGLAALRPISDAVLTWDLAVAWVAESPLVRRFAEMSHAQVFADST